MPLNKKGKKIMKSMKKQYGKKKGEKIFYASKNKGVIKGVKKGAYGAFNYIATGKPEMPVGGQKRMLAEKRRNSKAY
jgi:hypothetical protein